MSKDRNRQRKIDKNWENIFVKDNVLEFIEENKLYYISSEYINNFKYDTGFKIDARNMTKFDYINSLPDIFYNNGLSILPTKRGEYVIGRFNAYKELDVTNKVFEVNLNSIKFPEWIETLDYNNITSESIMLNASYISGMFNVMFGTEEVYETVNGRMGSGIFGFEVQDTNNKSLLYDITVKNSQIEIDGGYETKDKLILVEAKNIITESMLIRQLYYPYRLWNNKVKKEVVPVYLQYNDGVYSFIIYKFDNEFIYNSIREIERYNFIIDNEIIYIQEIRDILEGYPPIQEDYDIPFPQANSLNKIVNMLKEISVSENGYITSEELSLINDFTFRQSDYYYNAGLYLGYVYGEEDKIYLTSKGEELIRKRDKELKLKLTRDILQHLPFRKVMIKALGNKEYMTQGKVYEILRDEESYMPGYSESTRNRRSSTIAKWINEIIKMIN